MSETKRGLGRGLSSLLGDAAREQPTTGRAPGMQMLAVAALTPNATQPRRQFDDAALDELAASIATRGLIQPIVVRPRNGGYEIVAGERRWRAAQRARLHDVPVLIRELDDAETFALAIIENIQRKDLNPIEEADAFQRLISEYGHGQEAIAKLVGKSRSHIANLLRLLDLPVAVRDMVVRGELQMGHARALVTAPDPQALAEEVVRRGLSVRETERLAKGTKGDRIRRAPIEYKGSNADVDALERRIADLLGLKVAIAHGPQGGSVTLAYSSLAQLDMICERLTGEPI